MKVLNFGSLNIDYVYQVQHFVKKGETLSSDDLHVYSGGKGLNQSVALAKAGAEVYHAGMVGEDGTFLLEVLQKAGVDTSHVLVRGDVKTGHAIIQNDREGDNCILLYGGANQSMTKEYVDQVLACFEPEDFIVLQNEINEMDYLVEQAHEKGMRIALNPSPMNGLVLRLPLDQVDYFILNEVEAGQILGTDDTDEEALIRGLSGRFPKAQIVLTLGEKGSLFETGGQQYRQPAKRVKAVDTTAAGDTFTGYFVAGLMQERPVKDILNRAATASAIAVTRNGAAPSIPAAEEVEKELNS